MKRSSLLPFLALLSAPAAAVPVAAQTIPVRTVPVASGDQFLMLPSATLSMGGVRLAVDDSLADGWTNPAKGTFVRESAFLGSPTYYAISERNGGGRTFPVAGLFAGGEWFGGAALALQQIENDDGRGDVFFAPAIDVCCAGCCGGGRTRTLSEAFGRNVYATGYVGRRLSDGWSAGVGLFLAGLGAMDGVDLLYAGSDRIDQSGEMSDVRVGLHRTVGRDRLSVLLLHNRVSMRHEVAYTDWIWDPDLMRQFTRTRVELNEDQTRTWGGRVSWDRELAAPGWRVGVAGTINYKDHPKIPNYSLQNIPRDPGTTWAYEAALGFSRSVEATTFGLDFALQPIWSETWQVANAEDVLDSGQRLAVGDRSIENDFFFTNVVIRSGLSHQIARVQAQAGLQIHSYAYSLEQVNRVDGSYREQDESWIEWTPTFGAVLSLEAMDLRYSGLVTTGTGRPGTVAVRAAPALESLAGGDVVLAPDGALTLQESRVVTHQLSVRIPIR